MHVQVHVQVHVQMHVQVYVQVHVQMHVQTCSIVTPCQSSMALMVKGRQNPWGMGDFRNPVFNM